MITRRKCAVKFTNLNAINTIAKLTAIFKSKTFIAFNSGKNIMVLYNAPKAEAARTLLIFNSLAEKNDVEAITMKLIIIFRKNRTSTYIVKVILSPHT